MKNLLLVATAIAAMLASAPAHALSFDFSFTNVTGNVPGTVTGRIDGLVDNTTSAATQVTVNSFPSGVMLGVSAPFDTITASSSLINNSFTLSSGVITLGNFGSISASNNFALFIATGGLIFELEPNIGSTNVISNHITFNPVGSPVPGPIAGAGLPGLILASGGLLGWWRRRKKIV